MNCRNCTFEQVEEFDTCPKCGAKQLSVFTKKSEPLISNVNKTGDYLKGILLGGAYGIMANAILTTFQFLILMMASSFQNIAWIVYLILILVFYIGGSLILARLMIKLFKNIGLEKHQVNIALFTYVFVSVFFLMNILT